MGEEQGENGRDGSGDVMSIEDVEFDYIVVKLSHFRQVSFCSSKSDVLFTRCYKRK